jgi:hypothetical protein
MIDNCQPSVDRDSYKSVNVASLLYKMGYQPQMLTIIL